MKNNGLNFSKAEYKICEYGKSQGKPSVVLYLNGCNLLCGGSKSKKTLLPTKKEFFVCNTMKQWSTEEFTFISNEYLIKKMNSDFDFINHIRKGASLIFTGGEPMLQQLQIIDFTNYIEKAYNISPYIEFETNGTIALLDSLKKGINRQFNISPKLSNSGNNYEKRVFHNDYLFLPNSNFIFAVNSEEDMIEVVLFQKQYGIKSTQIFISPYYVSGQSNEEYNETKKTIINYAKKATFNFTIIN